VTASIPARAILVALAPDAEDSELGGDATAVCSVLGGQNVCSERVRLVAQGGVCTRVASVVDSLLVPEIPTALVWLGRVHVTDPVFLSLSTSAQRIITDSEYTSLSSLLHLAAWARRGSSHAHIADLAWTRLAPWQELFARFFDDPRLHDHAGRITRIAFRQASDAGARLGSEAALLLGWIATRLGWRTSRMGGALRFQRPDGKNIPIEFGVTPRPEGTAPSALASVRLEADHADVHVEGVIERELASGLSSDAVDADMVNWTLRVGASPPIEQRVRFGANKAAKWLERTLHRPARDPALTESVAFAEEVLEDGVVCGAPSHPR
jgi:glucose-6-phosphate dehydrogenase assembly protein OpcA